MTEDLSLLRRDFIKRIAYTYFTCSWLVTSVLFFPSVFDWIFNLPPESTFFTPIEQYRFYSSILTHPFSNVYFEHFLESGSLGLSFYLAHTVMFYSCFLLFLILSVLFLVEGILLLLARLSLHLD
jgi:hypothetical protein